jgi:hypothetical protein
MKPWLRLTLVAVSVGGGVTGVYASMDALVNKKELEPISYAILTGALLIYAFVAASGLVFVQNPRRVGLLQVGLALQCPWVSSPILVYKLVCAALALVSVTLNGKSGKLGIHFGVNFQLETLFRGGTAEGDSWEFGCNLFPVFFLVLVRRALRTEVTVQESVPNGPNFWDSLFKPPSA